MKVMKPASIGILLAIACGAAQAEEVTLYGVVDLNVNRYTAGSRSGVQGRTAMNDGTNNGLSGSRLGFRASEDLGSGFKVGAVLEAGFNADTGQAAQGGRTFGRQAYAWISHTALGEVRMGRQYLFEDGVQCVTNPFCNALTLNPGTSVSNAGKSLPLWLNASRADNVLQYRTPAMAGLTLGAQYSPGENVNDSFIGLNADFRRDAFVMDASYEWNRSRSTGDASNRSLTAGANYNFGAFKLLGGVQDNRNLQTGSGNGPASCISNLVVIGPSTLLAKSLRGYTVGIEAPVGASWLVGTNYTTVAYKDEAGAKLDMGKAAVGARYELSRRTHLYSSASMATGDLKKYIDAEYVVQAGMRVIF